MKKAFAILLVAVVLMMAIPFTAMAEETTNLAVGKKITASSYDINQTWGASKAVDGHDWHTASNWTSDWFTSSNPNKENWLEVDLGTVYALESVELASYFDSDNVYRLGAKYITVEVRANASDSWTKVVDKKDVSEFAGTAKTPVALPANTTGRFVKVTLTGMWDETDALNCHAVGELRIMGKSCAQSDKNLVAGKTVTASSDQGEADYAAGKITDGDLKSFWMGAFGAENVSHADLLDTLEVDLGAVSDLNYLSLYCAPLGERIIFYNGPKAVTLEVSTDGTNWTAVEGVVKAATDNGAWNTRGYHFELPAGTEGRYVKVTLHGTWGDGDKYIALAEMELLGKAKSGSPDTGDYMNTAIMVLPILALCGMAAVVIFRKKFSV